MCESLTVPPPAAGNSKSGANTISVVELGFGEADLTADGEVAVGCAVDTALDVVSAGLLELPGLLLLPHATTNAAKIPPANSPDRAIRLFRYPVCFTHRTWSRLSPLPKLLSYRPPASNEVGDTKTATQTTCPLGVTLAGLPEFSLRHRCSRRCARAAPIPCGRFG